MSVRVCRLTTFGTTSWTRVGNDWLSRSRMIWTSCRSRNSAAYFFMKPDRCSIRISGVSQTRRPAPAAWALNSSATQQAGLPVAGFLVSSPGMLKMPRLALASFTRT